MNCLEEPPAPIVRAPVPAAIDLAFVKDRANSGGSLNMLLIALKRRMIRLITRCACADDSNAGSLSPPHIALIQTLGGTNPGPMTSEVKNPSKAEMSMHSSGVTPDIRNSSNSVISDSESGVVKEIIDIDPSAQQALLLLAEPQGIRSQPFHSLNRGLASAGSIRRSREGENPPRTPPAQKPDWWVNFYSPICPKGGSEFNRR